jgi:hypothetical protein
LVTPKLTRHVPKRSDRKAGQFIELNDAQASSFSFVSESRFVFVDAVNHDAVPGLFLGNR